MASPAQKYRFSGLSEFNAENIGQLDEMLEDLYTFLSTSPLGIGESVFNLEELDLNAGLLTVDADGDLASFGSGSAGAFIRQGTTAAEWSTLTLPNAATTGDVLYASAVNTIARLADVATGNALLSGGVGVAPSWGKVGLQTHTSGLLDLTTQVSGVLPIANGGTNKNSFTTGSVIYFDGTRLQEDNAGLFFDATNNRLGVGVASPTEAVDVRGTTPDIGLRHSGADGFASFRFYEGVTQKAIIQHVGSNFVDATRRDDLELYTLAAGADVVAYINSTERARISSAGLAVVGLLDLSAASSGQIKFAAAQNASADANTLDDYEEGSWTPVIGGDGGTSGQVYNAQVGRYIKIGQLVVVKCTAALTTKGTITGNVQIQGLPFTVENVSLATWNAAIIWHQLATSWVYLTGYVTVNGTTVNIVGATAASTTNVGTALTTADIANNSQFGITLCYRATA